MWKNKEKKAPIIEFLGFILFSTLLVNGILLLLENYSIAFAETGKMTFGYLLYAVIGMLFSTPAPIIWLFVVLRRHEHITVKEYFRRIFYTPKPLVTIFVTGGFMTAAFVFALFCGTRIDAPWYMMPLGFLIMIPFVGIAEETGWRGFLQPSLEEKFPFPVATAFTAAIWAVWHFPIWLQPTSNHYGDSLIGFVITIFVWAFVSAAIYKATKSVLACALYHAFINAIGAIYDWNALFDAYPKNGPMLLYFAVTFIAAIIIWIVADKKEKRRADRQSVVQGGML